AVGIDGEIVRLARPGGADLDRNVLVIEPEFLGDPERAKGAGARDAINAQFGHRYSAWRRCGSRDYHRVKPRGKKGAPAMAAPLTPSKPPRRRLRSPFVWSALAPHPSGPVQKYWTSLSFRPRSTATRGYRAPGPANPDPGSAARSARPQDRRRD